MCDNCVREVCKGCSVLEGKSWPKIDSWRVRKVILFQKDFLNDGDGIKSQMSDMAYPILFKH